MMPCTRAAATTRTCLRPTMRWGCCGRLGLRGTGVLHWVRSGWLAGGVGGCAVDGVSTVVLHKCASKGDFGGGPALKGNGMKQRRSALLSPGLECNVGRLLCLSRWIRISPTWRVLSPRGPTPCARQSAGLRIATPELIPSQPCRPPWSFGRQARLVPYLSPGPSDPDLASHLLLRKDAACLPLL